MVSVTDESIDVMLRTVLACWHLKYVRDAKQSLVGVAIYNNLQNKQQREVIITTELTVFTYLLHTLHTKCTKANFNNDKITGKMQKIKQYKQ